MNATTRWSAIWRNVVTAPTNPPQVSGALVGGEALRGQKGKSFAATSQRLKGVRDSSSDS